MTRDVDLPLAAVPSSHALARRAEPVAVGLGGLLLAAVPAAADGGFFADTWAWLALGSFVVTTLRLILARSLGLRRLDWILAGAVALYGAWVALGALWTVDLTATLDEVVRTLAYGGVVVMLLVVLRRGTVRPFLLGLLVGVSVISTYALVSRLRPDWVGTWAPDLEYRLPGPIGYWNGLGLYAVMGTLLALGLAARSPSLLVRGVAGAMPTFLVTTVLLTFSRGAWLALAVGLLAMLAVDVRRLQLLATALLLSVGPVIAIALAVGSDHLTKRDATLAEATDDGGRLLGILLVLAAVSAAAAVLLGLAERRLTLPGTVMAASRAVVVMVVAGGIAAVLIAFGSPWSLAEDAIDAINKPSPGTSVDVSDRLLDLSSNGRVDLWEVAVGQFRESPLAGQGAGTWQTAWDRERPYEGIAQDAHSLYVETLGELGVVGLALLVAALAVPLVAAVRARERRATSAALGAYAAFAAHAGVDWDWELVGVTVVGLAAGVALVVSARRGQSDAGVRLGARVAVASATGVLALVAVGAVLATVPTARAREAYNRLDFPEAVRQAERAIDRAPWSSEARNVHGRALLAEGKIAAARRSLAEAASRSPRDWELWRDLAAASGPEAALAALARAERLNPLERELKDLRAQVEALSR